MRFQRTRRTRSIFCNALTASLLVVVTAVLSTAPAVADPLAVGDDELFRELEKTRQLELEAARLEAEAEAAREAEIERKRREVSERNSAVEREREARLKAALAEQMQMQDVMLERRERNETATKRDLLGAHRVEPLEDEQNEPREAPSVPEVRDLPRAIFDDKNVTIDAGTAGFTNKRDIKAVRLSLDADRDGQPEVIRYAERKKGTPLRQEEDRNYDGLMDSFLIYESGRIIAREVDSNHDGKPDIFERYDGKRQTERSLDRDYDNVVDAFYEFEGRYLARERHDANNDGTIDLTIDYEKGRREKAQEDTDRDGRPDTWTRYGLVDGRETVTRIEVDKSGRGFADTFESFEPLDGKAVISRREEDMDGDGEVDLVSIYQKGKLVRREILKPEVVPL